MHIHADTKTQFRLTCRTFSSPLHHPLMSIFYLALTGYMVFTLYFFTWYSGHCPTLENSASIYPKQQLNKITSHYFSFFVTFFLLNGFIFLVIITSQQDSMQNQNSINQKQLLSYKSLPGGYSTLNKIKYNCCCSGLEPHLVKV